MQKYDGYFKKSHRTTHIDGIPSVITLRELDHYMVFLLLVRHSK